MISKKKQDDLDRTAIKLFKELKQPLYDGDTQLKDDGEPIGIVLYKSHDTIGAYCVVQCTCCKHLGICRLCPTEEDMKRCINIH